MKDTGDRLTQNEDTDLERALSKISEQATTGTPITPGPDAWVKALPELDDVACEWMMEDSLLESYLWADDGHYYAANLPSGLEDLEGRPLGPVEAASLLESGLSHKPVDRNEVPA